MLSPTDLARLAETPWYYEIELAEGVVTKGHRHVNIAVVRDFLRGCGLQGATCLDIGTQEFVCPVLMLRQGAKQVVGYDRLSLMDRYVAVQQAYGVTFDYVHGVSMRELKGQLAASRLPTQFDFVNFSGVMYHMVDPLAGLAIARSFVREGGLMMFESAVLQSSEYICAFNHHGKMYPGSNYFLVSTAALDYWLRMLRLEIVDCGYRGGEICRLVVIAQAVGQVVAEADDKWMTEHWVQQDFVPFGLKYDELRGTAPPVPYQMRAQTKPVPRAGMKSLDINATMAKTGNSPVDMELVRLRLQDRW